MGLRAPSHTQTPNEIFDEWLPLLGLAELKVLMVIIRKTFGWHKIRDRISLSQLEKLTGLGKTNISKTTKRLIEKGLIVKQVTGKNGTQETHYELVIDDNSNNSYQCRKDTPTSVAEPLPPRVVKTPTKETLSKEKEKNKQKDAQPTEADLLCDFIFSKIQEKKPNFTGTKSPTQIKSAGKLLKLRSRGAVEKIVQFALESDFWDAICTSPAKVLKHLDTLEIQMGRPSSSTKGGPNLARIQADKELALKVKKMYPREADIIHGDGYIEFDCGPSNRPHLKFGDNAFKEQIIHYLRKLQLPTEGL